MNYQDYRGQINRKIDQISRVCAEDDESDPKWKRFKLAERSYIRLRSTSCDCKNDFVITRSCAIDLFGIAKKSFRNELLKQSVREKFKSWTYDFSLVHFSRFFVQYIGIFFEALKVD